MEELVEEKDSVGEEELRVGGSVVGDSTEEAVVVGGSVLGKLSVAGSETRGGETARTVVICPFSKLTRRPYLVSR